MDPVHFTGREILEMAVKIEENGFKYYTDAGKASKSTEIKELFSHLASDEKKHIKVFSDLVKLVPPEEMSDGQDAYSEEAHLYLRSLANTEVFTAPDAGKNMGKIMQGGKSVLEFAIGMEKDAILFYYELTGMVRDKDRTVLDSLIAQEKTHLKKLTKLLERLYK